MARVLFCTLETWDVEFVENGGAQAACEMMRLAGLGAFIRALRASGYPASLPSRPSLPSRLS